MPPKVALLICFIFILYLFKLEYKSKPDVSIGLWIPLIWMMIIGSRSVSLWLNLGIPMESPEDYLEGSPIDRNVFTVLIVLGLLILFRRKVSWEQIWRENTLIFLFFIYCGISVLWSDFPIVSMKRWIKEVGTLIMVFVILSDPNREEAIKAILRRSAYILVPLSVLFIKYYPEFGRGYNRWTWEVYYTGVTVGKNSLGVLCLVFGLFFIWSFLLSWKKIAIDQDKERRLVHFVLLLMIVWLFSKANSATSLVCFIIGVCVILGTQIGVFIRNTKSFGRYMLIAGLSVLALMILFDMEELFLSGLDRNETLTGRTDIWSYLLTISINPVIGTGYESFWLGNRAEILWEKYAFLNQAHNGYLETYLNLGVIGLFFLGALIASAYRNIRKGLERDFYFGAFRLALLIVVLLNNLTEASFKGLSFLWFVFLLIGTEMPRLLEVKSFFSNKNVWRNIDKNALCKADEK